MDDQLKDLRIKRYRTLAKVRALYETIVRNLGQLHGAVLTGLGNEAAPVGMLLAYGELMDEKTFLFSPKAGDQRSQMPIAAVSDMFVESEHDHSYSIIYNHLQRKGVEDGNVHWGCYPHGIWAFHTSDMLGLIDLVAGGSWRARKYVRDAVGLYLFGEGALSQGVGHEVFTWISAQNCVRTSEQLKRYRGPLSERALTSGVLRPVPAVFGVQINRWSIYTDTLDEHGGRDVVGPDGKSAFAKWTESYGMLGIDVDGDDLEAVIHATKKLVQAAQSERPVAGLLILHMEMRRTAHNEHMITRPEEARKSRDWSRGTILGVDQNAFEKAWEEGREPRTRYRNYLVDLGIASKNELDAIFEEERALMDERWDRASKDPPATLEDSIKKRERKYFMLAPHEWSLPHLERPLDKMFSGVTTTTQAFLETMTEILEKDPDAVYSGEDVGSGGVLVATRELRKKFGAERVFDTPIAEAAILGTSAGASIEQWILAHHGAAKNIGTPFFEAQFMDFDADWLQRVRSLSPNYYQKGMPHHFVAFTHYGVVHGGGSGNFHSNDRAFDYMGNPGIAVVCASDAFDLVGLLRAAYESMWPVIFMIPIWSYGEQECAAEIPKEKYLIPLGKGAVKRVGKDVSVITYGTCVRAVLNEAKFLAEEGIDVEIVDLRTLNPLDMDTIAESVKKTGRVVVMTEAMPQMAELIAGKIVTNPELSDALVRTPKPRQQPNEDAINLQARVKKWLKETRGVFGKFAYKDLEPENLGPRIARLSRDYSPIASAESIEWGDLPFEWYISEEKDRYEDTQFIKRLRSVRLSAIVHDLMEYK